ncbi:MAG: GntR family transcriptional regulator [Paracoccus sp. (in: a-proteobacteria)]|nr:GntR family transcriptional regulator [Paracoccus sp. (in: a-proteobacteria)]
MQNETAPLYGVVWTMLRDKIADGELAPGARLSEAGIARQLGVSRTPVRRALAQLADEGVVRRRGSRGHVVEGGAPVPLSPRDLSDIFADVAGGIERSVAWERIFDTVCAEITACMPFGSYRIQEAELGSFHHASRTVAREVLSKLSDRRLISKDRRSHWVVGQMTGRDIRETFAMRRALEPVALRAVGPELPRSWLGDLAGRIASVIADFPRCSSARIDALEHDMHGVMLDGLRNARMLGSIRRNQVAMVVPRLFRAAFPHRDDLETVHAYGQIVHHLLAGTHEAAAVLLETHLQRVEALTLSRLLVLSVVPAPPTAPYLLRV